MASLGFGKWNDLMKQFLDELHLTFPSFKEDVDAFKFGMTTASTFSESKPCRMFVGAVDPHAALLERKDPDFFAMLGSVAGVDFAYMFSHAPDEHTRDVIFEYAATLYVFGKRLIGQ
jgi:hypothetical protein